MATCPSILLELHLAQIAAFANQILKLQLYLLLLLGGKPEAESSKGSGDAKLQFLKIRLENTYVSNLFLS